MAKRKSAPKATGGEGKAPLVIALAFFVIATIAAGVMAYTFEGDIDAARKAAKDKDDEAKAANNAARIADYRLKLHQLAVGVGTADDEASLKAAPTETEIALRDDHAKIVAAFDARIKAAVKADAAELAGLKIPTEQLYNWPWPAGAPLAGGPTTSVPDRMVKLIVEREQALRYVTQAKAAYDAAAAKAASEKTAYEADRSNYANKLAAKDAEVVAHKKKLDDELKTRAAAYEKAAADYADARKKAADEIEPLKTKLARTEEELRAAREALLLTKQAQTQDKVIQFDNPAGSVLMANARTGTVEIDLGSADRVRPGLTFKVYPREAKDRGSDKTAREKATIEVVEVLSPNLSRARVTFLEDDIRKPIVKGDLLYSLTWQKGRTDHVVLIGIFDTDGDGTDDIKTVARDLEKMGVAVDGYFDLATRKWVGAAPGYRTDYAILGSLPTVYPGDPLAAQKTELATAAGTADAAAKDKGVTIIRAREFFAGIGYKVKQNVSDDAVNQAAAKYLKAAEAAPAAPPPAN